MAQGIDGVEVSVSSSRGDDALEAVRQARADAAVVWSRQPRDGDLDGVVLGSVLFGVVIPPGHRAAGSARVPVAALAGDVLVMFPRDPFAGVWDRTVDHFFPSAAAAVVAELVPAVAAANRLARGPLGERSARDGLDQQQVGGLGVLPARDQAGRRRRGDARLPTPRRGG